MRRRIILWSCSPVLLTLMSLASCRDNPLSVDNSQQPSVTGVFSTPATVEAAISRAFEQMYNGQLGSGDDLFTQTITMSFESSSQLGNFGMGTRGSIPRSPIDNSIGNSVAAGNFRDFDFLSRNARLSASAIAAMDKFIAANAATGSVGRDARARSVAYFELGYALGNVALFYDSAAILSPQDPTDALGNFIAPPLSGASAVMDAAIKYLDSAVVIATAGPATTIPLDWLGQVSDVTNANYIRILRSYRAKFRAGFARTPAARDAADWNAVIADATNGITTDFVVQTSTTTGWRSDVQNQMAVSTAWSQMTPFILGMADTTGAYDTWLQLALTARTPFLLRTPDKRFPAGNTRAVQQALTGNGRGGTPIGSILYFRNRPTGEDSPAEPWGTWFYDNWRSWGIRAAGGNGPYVMFAVAENDMLAAEGYLRTGQFTPAVTLINKYRTRAGLAPIGAVAAVTDQVPNSSATAKDCVPRVPQPPNYNTTACGTVFEAMKWEKRIETSMIGYGQWFIDSRGWGDLVTGTALEWPVPYQELFARNRGSYTTTAKAVKGTYGF
ncbi:MAG: RagB/SusD family nutrient uptake outer membrane protein [Gemmatimonadota bacterium]|nr:RagB/SusD family nutrient uptake outer membrane protein [Gemmatimonadota bacterium]